MYLLQKKESTTECTMNLTFFWKLNLQSIPKVKYRCGVCNSQRINNRMIAPYQKPFLD